MCPKEREMQTNPKMDEFPFLIEDYPRMPSYGQIDRICLMTIEKKNYNINRVLTFHTHDSLLEMWWEFAQKFLIPPQKKGTELPFSLI